MIAQNIIIMILSILALVDSISSRPYINTTLAARQTNTTVVARQLTGPANVGGLDLNSGTLTGGLTLQQATEICGNAQLNCCSQASGSGGVTGSGLIGAVFGSGGPGIQCNLMNFPIIGPQASMVIKELCEAKVACCKGQTSQANLLDLNCIALSSLI